MNGKIKVIARIIKKVSKRKIFFLNHLGISCLVGLLVLIWIFFVWYPMPLAKATGVTQIIIMMLLIDIVIGPILGVLVFKEQKKSLKFDLCIIILIQLAAFLYGFYSVAQGRPVYVAFVVDRFELIRKNELIKNNIEEILTQFDKEPLLSPVFVGTQYSNNTDRRNNDMFEDALAGISIAQKPERYVDLSKVKAEMKQKALTLKELVQYNSIDAIDKVLVKYPQADAWLPFKANAVDMVVLINKEKAEVIKIVDLRPWK